MSPLRRLWSLAIDRSERGAHASLVAVCLLAGVASAQGTKPEEPQSKPAPQAPAMLSADDARSSERRALAYLLAHQNPDGSWGSGAIESVLELGFSVESFYAWKMASQGVVCMALMAVDETPERRAALDRALLWLCESRLPKRGNDWDVDYNWTNLYGFTALVQAAQDPRFQSDAWQKRIAERGREFYALLDKNQEPEGGWGYYEGPVVSQRPTWSTSFATASVIPALVEAEKLKWPVEPKMLHRAVEYIKRCGLPNGAYEYDLNVIPRISGGEHINDVKGSLGRIQVCNWALARAGVQSVTIDKIREGVEAFLKEHKFLDFARMRPIPHEGYYANAGYFYFFGHYYAALAINLLPPEEREALHARLRPHLVKVQWNDGSSMDFQGSSYLQTASTAFSIMALEAGLKHDGAKAKASQAK